MQARHPIPQAAVAVALALCLHRALAQGEAGQPPAFVVHGSSKTCSAITQLDSALSSDYQAFFAGWTEKDYADATAWAEGCAAYGWHVPGRPRVPLLHSQHDRALGLAAAAARPSAPSSSLVPTVAPAPAVASVLVRPAPMLQARLKWGAVQEMPSNGSDVIGFDATITSHFKDTLPDIARRYGLGYEEIYRANPGIDVWLPGEGTRILLPGRHRLPPGAHEGVVVNLAEHRLYYFPKVVANERPKVITYPVSIGKLGQSSPLGKTVITAKVEHPSWYPPASARRDYAARGEILPAVVGPGPENPLGDYMMRLGFGNGAYEIHGTNKPVSVGMDATYGCIGMYPEDVAALFAQVRVGTPVRLVNERS